MWLVGLGVWFSLRAQEVLGSNPGQAHPCLLLINNWASLIAQLVKNLHAMQETPVRFLVGKIPWRRDKLPTPVFSGFPGGSDGKESACNGETWVWPLSWEDPLEEGKSTHSSILAWRIPMDRGAWWAAVHGVANSQTWLSDKAQHIESWARLE